VFYKKIVTKSQGIFLVIFYFLPHDWKTGRYNYVSREKINGPKLAAFLSTAGLSF